MGWFFIVMMIAAILFFVPEFVDYCGMNIKTADNLVLALAVIAFLFIIIFV